MIKHSYCIAELVDVLNAEDGGGGDMRKGPVFDSWLDRKLDQGLILFVLSWTRPVSRSDEVKELFNFGYDAYMNHAYPADELMPLSCKGRYRGVDQSRGDIDDALGK